MSFASLENKNIPILKNQKTHIYYLLIITYKTISHEIYFSLIAWNLS